MVFKWTGARNISRILGLHRPTSRASEQDSGEVRGNSRTAEDEKDNLDDIWDTRQAKVKVASKRELNEQSKDLGASQLPANKLQHIWACPYTSGHEATQLYDSEVASSKGVITRTPNYHHQFGNRSLLLLIPCFPKSM